ncbi:MAG TPA: homocysteine S-methyltransferase family protein [Syntrophales bacterium]|nr:homocysteine S-methyltransferase family protein [Syntrophales bacterium]
MRKHGNRKIKGLMEKKVLVLDGATGTELQRLGMPAGVSPELWCDRNPETLLRIQRAYGDAGADVIYTCTFGANRLKLKDHAFHGDVRDLNRRLALITRAAAGPRRLVAGDLGPTGRFVEPFGDLPFEEAVAVYREQAEGLLKGGVDLFVIETMMDIQEARAALIAVKELGDHFAFVTMTYEKEGRTLGGTDPVTALITLQSLGADAVGCNCSVGPKEMLQWLRAMAPSATVPLVAKPNAGLPRLTGGRAVYEMDPETFASFAAPFAEAGVLMAGGCCGTTPDHIAALASALEGVTPRRPARRSVSAVSSARAHKVFEAHQPLVVIGERINPTGKKNLQEELRRGRTDMVRALAREQQEAGAELLDVNVGVPGIDEAATMVEAVKALAHVTDLPLVIDSPRVATLEAALRIYPGRALVNSVSGEREKVETLLPLVRRYGAMFILLPLADGEVPEDFPRRRAVIGEVWKAARRLGFAKEDVVIDGLVMTVASRQDAPRAALETIAWAADRFRCPTVLGLSNVSFGLPERRWLNAAFLAMAVRAGLTMAIADPTREELMGIRGAADCLTGRDREGRLYVRRYGGGAPAAKGGGSPVQDPAAAVTAAVLEGDREGIEGLVRTLLETGREPREIVEGVLIPAIVEVGRRYERRQYFLPQLMAGAEAMKRGLALLEPLLGGDGRGVRSRGLVLLATVKGDIHDIGKNIVALMLRNHGFEVLDLGRDVPTEEIIRRMKEKRPRVVGLSALMTTTMAVMGEVVAAARREGLMTPFILGGAVVTPEFASSLGAAYGRDGVEAVRVVAELTGEKEEG